MKQYLIQLNCNKDQVLFDNLKDAELFLNKHNNQNFQIKEIEISDTYYQQRVKVNKKINTYFENNCELF